MKFNATPCFKGAGAKTGRLLLAGCVCALSVPAVALAIYQPANNTGKALMSGETGDTWNNQIKKGDVVANADGTSTVSYTGIAHSDLSHYSAYGLTAHITYDAKGKVTAINLTSEDDTFAGSWGYKNAGKSVAPIEGLLPDGVSFSASRLEDGSYKPVLAGADALGYSVKQVTLMTIGADGSLVSSEEQIVAQSSGGGKGGYATKAWGGGSTTYTYGDWNNKTSTLALSEKHASTNLVQVRYTIGAESAITFNTYFAIAADGSIDSSASSAANKYVDGIEKTTYDADPDLTGTMADTNRNKWAAIMATVLLQRELQSWSEALQSDFEAAGEIDDLDTISGATKTSEPLVEALNQSVVDGYVKSVAENVKVTIDGTDIDLNKTPMDQSTVSINADGKYVLSNIFPLGDDRSATHGTTLDSISLYSLENATTADVAAIAKDRSNVAPIAVIEGGSITGYEEDDGDPIYGPWEDFSDDNITLDYDDSTGPIVVTANNKAITHIAMTYTLGHGSITICYDLKQMVAAGEVNEAIAAMDATDEASVAAAREAYNALNTDVRCFVTNIDSLLNAEEAIAAKATQKITFTAPSTLKRGKTGTLKVKAAGKVTITAASSKFLSVTKKGKITMAKAAKAGKTYTLKVKVSAASTADYKAASKTISLKVKAK